MTLTALEINELAQFRTQQFASDRRKWDILSAIWYGRHADLYPDEFPTKGVQQQAGLVRRSWKMFARHIGKPATIYVSPLKETAGAKNDADRLEKIAVNYNRVWAMQRKAKAKAIFSVGFGAVGIGLVADPRIGYPQLLVEDPRNCLPGAGWDSTSVPGIGFLGYDQNLFIPNGDSGGSNLEDMIVRKSMTGGQIKKVFGSSDALNKAIPDTNIGLHRPYSVLMYYDQKDCVTTLGGTDIVLSEAPHGAPWCPWWFLTNFGPESTAGDSDFFGQIGLEVAFLTILNQKMALNDAVSYPWMALTGSWDVKPDQRLLQAASPDAKVQVISPPPTFEVDKDLAMLRDLLRTLNMETEATQGRIPGGPITGQGVDAVNQGTVVEVVQSYFDDYKWLMPNVYATALIMDREVFPNTTKDISGRYGGEPFFDSYVPAKDIGPRFGSIACDYGPGLGGYQGHIQMLQDVGADVYDKTSVMEHNPFVRSVRTVRTRLFIEKLEALELQAMLGQAAVPMEWIAACRKAVGDGDDPYEWILTHPASQSSATPGNVGPVPPEVAAAAAAQGGGPPGAGGAPPPPGGGPPPGAGPGGPPGLGGVLPGQVPAGQGGLGPGPNMWSPPRLSRLMGS